MSQKQLNRDLCDAVYKGDIEKVRSTIYKGANVDACCTTANLRYGMPFGWAIKKNYVDIVETLIDEYAEINSSVALNSLISYDNFEFFKILINKGGDVHSNNGSALRQLIYTQRVDWIKYLLNNGTNINTQYSDGTTPLSFAVDKKNIEMTKWLLENGAKYSAPTASLTAIEKGSWEILEILLEHLPNINYKYTNGTTCLITAIRVGDLKIVEKLLENGADVNLLSLSGISPLNTAIEMQKSQITIYLLNKGADPNLADGEGKSPFTLALQLKQMEVLKILIKVGVKIHFEKHVIKKALNIFLELEDKELTKTLVTHCNADNDATLLFECIKRKYTNGVKSLVEYGINLNITSECGRTPLTMSVLTNNYDMVEYFIGKELKIDETDKNGDNALIVAARKNDFKFVDFLISRGADLEKVNDQMQELAKNNDNLAIYLENLKLERQKATQTIIETDAVPPKERKSEQDDGFSSNQE